MINKKIAPSTTWQHGNMATWQHGNMATWQHVSQYCVHSQIFFADLSFFLKNLRMKLLSNKD
jgi:hypothetical protein